MKLWYSGIGTLLLFAQLKSLSIVLSWTRDLENGTVFQL